MTHSFNLVLGQTILRLREMCHTNYNNGTKNSQILFSDGREAGLLVMQLQSPFPSSWRYDFPEGQEPSITNLIYQAGKGLTWRAE